MPSPLALSALVLPDRHPPAQFVADVRAAEQAGVRTVWTYDHLTWPLLQDGPWYTCVPLLAAASMATERVRLGIQVATPNYRHPVLFGKELMTLDQLCAGRLEVGLGAGVDGADALVLGDPPRSNRERFERFAEWVTLLDELLRTPVTTFRGRFYSAVEARTIPNCVQQPRVPFTIAASGPRGFGVVAAQGQAWVTYGPWDSRGVEGDAWFAALTEQAHRVDDALAAAGRDPGSLRRIAQFALRVQWPFESAERYADVVGRLGAAGFHEITVHWPREDGRGLPRAALDSVVDVHADQSTNAV